jgi:single-strand DNA-binding protein
MGINKAILVGNVGKDPVTKQVGESTVCNYTLATTDRRFKDADGKPRTEWHNITAWGKLAEITAQYVTKGQLLYIEGRIQTRSWVDDAGNKRYVTDVIADQMEMLGGRLQAAAPEKSIAPQQPDIAEDNPGY